jgi:two-component system sensor histidine kinase CiaH
VLKRMRWRLIGSGMAAITCVVTAMVILINVLNACVMEKQTDSVLSEISGADRNSSSLIGTYGIPVFLPFDRNSEERTFTTVFFRVDCDEDGNILNVANEFFTSISDDEAKSYAGDVIQSGKKKGSYKNFHWIIADSKDGKSIYFLNTSDQNRMIKTFCYLSCLVELITLLASFVLLRLFSKKAVEPYARNIEQQKQFITDAGHEIKTPLTSIATSADILAMDYHDNEWIDNIQKQTARLTRLVGDLVTLSRLDEAVPFPEKTEFILSDALWETAEPFISLAKAKNRRFTPEIAEGISFYGDKAAVQQMVSILLDNAIKYSTADGKIVMNVFKKHKHIVIEVINDCNLKETQNLNRLFDRFYRMDKSRNASTGGTGIGLSIAAATAAAHNGRITAESRDGKSICFRIVF